MEYICFKRMSDKWWTRIRFLIVLILRANIEGQCRRLISKASAEG